MSAYRSKMACTAAMALRLLSSRGRGGGVWDGLDMVTCMYCRPRMPCSALCFVSR